MARDAKVIQRGINNTANDLAVPPGTTTDGKNLAFDRDGVAARRLGHQDYWDGLPDLPFNLASSLGPNQGVFNLFSGDHLFHLAQGMMFARDDDADAWLSVPVNMPHQVALLGSQYDNNGNAETSYVRIGRMLAFCDNSTYPSGYGIDRGPLSWQRSVNDSVLPCLTFHGTIGNDAANATDATSVQNVKFRTAFDVVLINPGGGITPIVSDETTIRSSSAGLFGVFAVLAGSITLAGTTDATGTSARFTSATWMATDGVSNVYVADNGSAIRKVTDAGVVTTLAGSITLAGDTDGVGTAARFRNISGLAYDSGFLYVAEGASAHRIRKVDVTTGSVTIYAGALSPTSGFVNGTGTAARFNTPSGIEKIGSSLYVGDSGNNAIRRIVISSAAVTSYYTSQSSPSVNTGMVGGLSGVGSMPSPTVRGSYGFANGVLANGFATSSDYLAIETQAPNSSTDSGTLAVSSSSPVDGSTNGFYLTHVARSPNSLPTQTTGPNKIDTWGVDTYVGQDVRGVDVQGGAVFTTSEQPRILDAYTRLNAGDAMPRLRQLGIQAPEAPSCTTTTGSTFAANTAWAYRYLCGLYLPNGRIALGPPSERVIVTTSGAVAGSVTMFPAPGLPYDGLPFVQLYRTRTTSSSVTDPGDVMFLCNEQPLTYGSAVVVTDLCPDDLLGAELYTNQYAFGAQSASLPPPAYANEVAGFGSSVVVADFIPGASCRVKVLGVSTLVSGTSTMTFTCVGPSANDACNTLTIFFNSAATDPSIKRAQIASSGSAAQNAVQTARNICRVINRCPDAMMFRAFYDESDPGSFVVYSQYPGRSRTATATDSNGNETLTQSAITFATNASTSFITTKLSPAQRQQTSLAYSDPADADSFPVVNQIVVGASADAIQRCLPLAESLLVVKDTTIYRVSQSFSSEIYETALACTLPNSFARLNNQWIGLFTAGFRALTSSQAVAIGRPNDRRVTSRFGSGSYLGSFDFASGAASDRQGIYLCAFNKQVFSFSAYGGGAWGMFEMPWSEQPSWLGSHQDSFVPVISNYPRGVFWGLDVNNSPDLATLGYKSLFYDAQAFMVAAATVTASTSLTATLTAATSPLGIAPTSYVGAVVTTGSVTAAILSGAGTGGDPFILDEAVTIANAAELTVYLPIEIVAQYAPSLAPGINSQFGDIGVTLERASIGSLTCTFYNRKDALNLANSVIPYGQFGSANGIARTNVMGAVDSEVDDAYSYYDFQRFATPAERSQDQTMAVALSNRQALAPLAIKSVVVELTEGGKVKQ
jgi:hypothetical protein